MNREILDFDQFLDRILFKPVAQGYRTVVPQFGRDTVRHFLDNLGEPVIFANDMMQGEFKAAHDTFARFLINSTVGVGGLFDVAGATGIKRQSGDFGQTLYAWGVPDGPYLVLPIFGPSNPRDGIGMGVDAVMDVVSPIDWTPASRIRRPEQIVLGLAVIVSPAVDRCRIRRTVMPPPACVATRCSRWHSNKCPRAARVHPLFIACR